VRMYSRALSGGGFTVPGPLLTKKSPLVVDRFPSISRTQAHGAADRGLRTRLFFSRSLGDSKVMSSPYLR
jgi:hypothetical protein